MYIASPATNKIVKATLDGKFITSVGERGSCELQFNWSNVCGISIDSTGNIHVGTKRGII